MKESVEIYLEDLVRRYPSLEVCYADIEDAFERIAASFASGGKLLICGNGGSAADAQHIAGELMKGFLKRRPLPSTVQKAFEQAGGERGRYIASQLQGALPVIASWGKMRYLPLLPMMWMLRWFLPSRFMRWGAAAMCSWASAHLGTQPMSWMPYIRLKL